MHQKWRIRLFQKKGTFISKFQSQLLLVNIWKCFKFQQNHSTNEQLDFICWTNWTLLYTQTNNWTGVKRTPFININLDYHFQQNHTMNKEIDFWGEGGKGTPPSKFYSFTFLVRFNWNLKLNNFICALIIVHIWNFWVSNFS